jgi:hypothetical protein
MGRVGEENALLFRQQIKRILKNLENACMKRCDTFTLRVLQQVFVSRLQRCHRKEDKDEEEIE